MREAWQSKPVGACIEPVKYTRKIKRKDFLPDGAYPIVSQEDGLVNGCWNESDDVFHVRRPLVVFGDHTRVLKYIDFDFVLGADGVKILQPKEFIDPKYFFYNLHIANIESLGYARHWRLLSEHIVDFPSLAEQRRIVAILDEAFEAIATAEANTEKNLQNARELFESYVRNVFLTGVGAWPAKTVNQLAENLDSRRIPITKKDRRPGTVPYYGASGIVDYVADHIFEGDALLISEDGANLLARSTPIAFSVSGKYWVNNHVHILKFPDPTTQRFVEFYLESIRLDEYITGAAQPKLTQKALNSIPIHIPGAPGARGSIVARIERMTVQCDVLRSSYERKLGSLAGLKQSLLHQAFTGALTAKTVGRQLAEVA